MDRPKQAIERRWPILVQFLLGTAGIAVTAAGLYELTRNEPAVHVSAPVDGVRGRISPDIAPSDPALQEQQMTRQEELAEIRRKRDAAALRLINLQRRGARCMDGVWIIKEAHEIRSAGPC